MELLSQYSVLYCTIDVALLVFSISIYFAITQDFGSEEETLRFKQLVGTFLVYLVSDIVLGLVYGELLVLGELANLIVVYTNIITACLIAFLWYRYAVLRLEPKLEESRFHTPVMSIPILLMVLLTSASIYTGWVFTLTPGGGFNPSEYFELVFFLGALYLIIISIMAVIRLVTTRERRKRSRYLMFLLFLVPPVAATIMEILIPRTPVLALGFYGAIHMVFFAYQSQRIYNDSLTQLNNRRRIDEFLESHIGSSEMVFYMFDINRFKEVNDNFGHKEGDRALCYVADALRRSCTGRQAITGRYGGDEFVVVEILAQNAEEYQPDKFKNLVKEHLNEIGAAQHIDYYLTVSAGHAFIPLDAKDFEDIYTRADRDMYADKKKWRDKHPSVMRVA